MSLKNLNDNTTALLGVVGTTASWTLSGTLSLLATICTLIVVGPKAWDQLARWHAHYSPRIMAWVRERF